jgi:hypothetical protein
MTIRTLPPLPDLHTGAVALPTLTREELAVLDADPILRDATEDQAWADLPASVRDVVRDSVLRGLLARELAVPGQDGLVLDDTITLVLGVRAEPAFIVVADEPGSELRHPLRGYGIDLSDHHHDAVLLEFAADGLHRHLLTTLADAALRLASWALSPPEGSDVVARSLEVLEPTGSTPNRHRSIVLAARQQARMASLDDTDQPRDLTAIDAAGLAAWLQRAWGSLPSAAACRP